jgi:hypothetical protein
MKKIIFPLLGLFLLFSLSSFAYKNKKVVLVVSQFHQADTLGHNIVEAFSQWVYRSLELNLIRMWDSPKKEHQISFPVLQTLEKSSKCSFLENNFLFIYEYWTSNKSSSSFKIEGIRFKNDLSTQEVDFGYIEYSDIQELLKSAYVHTNVNGYYGITLHQILMNKYYDYDLLYFGNRVIQKGKDPEADFLKATKIKEKAFHSEKIHKNALAIDPYKYIEYIIDSENQQDTDNDAGRIFSALEAYFDKNREALYSYGGVKISRYFENSRLIISKCIVREIWIKRGERIMNRIVDVQPYSLGMAFKSISRDELVKLLILSGDENILSILLKKNFNFTLTGINHNEIPENVSELHLKALYEASWNKISHYVIENL